jgi:hypothetical protein
LINDDHKLDTQVTLLFNNAIEQIRKVEKDSLRQKKQIIIELAKKLEGKIPTDTICMEIKNQLHGNGISERHIEDCLDVKYKQLHRVKNAQKPDKSKLQAESKIAAEQEDSLVEPLRLNQEKEQEQSQDIIIAGSNGQMLIQEDNNDRNKEDPLSTIQDAKKVISNREGSLLGLPPMEQSQTSSNRCPECTIKDKKISAKDEEIVRLEELIKKSTPFVTADMLIPTEIRDPNSENISSDSNFELFIKYKDIQECLPHPHFDR